MEHNRCYDGTSQAPPEAIPLRAGPLELVYQAGDLRHIRLGEREVVRRIYFAARDQHWGTPPHTIERHTIESGSRSFRIYVIAHTRQDDVALYWEANISGEADGTIIYRLRVRAEQAFLSNRTGLCLLHPAQECAGAPCRVTHTDGNIEAGRFPERIAPHQPFMDIRAITHQVSEGVWATVTLEGDTFEMEDQRNWTDASFKTYSTPLALPIPVEIKVGQRITQTITLRLEGVDSERLSAPTKRAVSPQGVSVGPAAGKTLPLLGLAGAADAPELDAPQLAALRALRLDHLRVELSASTPDESLNRWVVEARSLGLALELALMDADPLTLSRAVAWLRQERLAVARVLLSVTPRVDAAGWLATTRTALAELIGDAPIGVGVNGYFTNLNRERPAAEGADLVFYSLNPQVHAFDNVSLIETLPTQAETVRSAQGLYPGKPIVVSPITLKPRPQTTSDPRQGSLLGAGWTLGSIASLAGAGATSLTYFETVGVRGVIAGARDASAPFAAQMGDLYPIYHLLYWLAGWRGAAVCATKGSDPLRLQALGLVRDGELRLLLANTSGKQLQVAIDGLGEKATALWLDENSVAAARLVPHAAPQNVMVRLGCACVTLPPYGLVCIDTQLG